MAASALRADSTLSPTLVLGIFVILLTDFALREDLRGPHHHCLRKGFELLWLWLVENKNFCGCMNVSKFNGISRINLNLSSP